MVLHRSGRAAGGLVVVAAVTAGLAASLGAGYTVAQATLDDSSAYVTKGTAVAHVNGESRKVDATSTGPALAENGDRVVTRTTPSGEVVAVNQRTGVITTINRGTASPTSTITPKQPVIKAPDVISSGTRSWLIDYDARAVRPMRNGVAYGGVDIEGRPVDAAPGPDSSVLVLTREGKLFRVGADMKPKEIDVDNGERASLTVAGGRTYLVTAANSVVDVYSDGARQVATVDGVGPGPDGRMLVGSILGSGKHVLIVSEALLTIVDPETGAVGESVSLGSGAHALGEPVEYRGRIYVPDYDLHRLIVVETATKQVLKKRVYVPGTQRYFDLFVTGDKLWANDQYAQRLVQLDGTTEHEIDKGSGNGVKPDPSPNSNPPKNTPPKDNTLPANGGNSSGGGRGGTGSTGNTGNGGATGDTRPEYVDVPRFPDGTTVDVACNRLIELRLRCNQVPREEPGKEDGVVINTVPGLPKKIAVGDSVTVIYVGPTRVPTIADGTQPIAACVNTITQAGLKCAYAPSAEPADSPDQYGTVAGTSPAAGTKVSNGQVVTIQYFNSFVMPDLNGKPGVKSCSDLSALSLVLPDAAGRAQPAQHPQCEATAGNSVDNGSKDKQNTIYEQKPPAGTEYQSGTKITVTYYSGQADLPDYRGRDLQPSLTDCSVRFTCSDTGTTVAAVDNGVFRAELVGKIARQLDGAGNNRDPGRYDVGTDVHFVTYRGDDDVPNVTGKSPDDACNQLTAAGYVCKRVEQPNPVSGSVVAQNPAGGRAGLGTEVSITYNPIQTRQLNLWTKDNVNIVRADNQPAPAGFTLVGNLGRAYEMNQGNGNWQLSEFTKNCDGHTPNIVYSHGTPQGCMAGGGGASAAGMIVPDNGVCGYGSVWLYRVSRDAPNNGIDYTVIRSNSNQKLNTPTQSPDPNWPRYTEGLGCIFPP